MPRISALTLCSLIVLSVGCGRSGSTPEEALAGSEARSVSTLEAALIGQWYSEDIDQRRFYSDDGNWSILTSDKLFKYTWEEKSQNLLERTLILEIDSDASISGSSVSKLQFSEDFTSFVLTGEVLGKQITSTFSYVDSKQEP